MNGRAGHTGVAGQTVCAADLRALKSLSGFIIRISLLRFSACLIHFGYASADLSSFNIVGHKW